MLNTNGPRGNVQEIRLNQAKEWIGRRPRRLINSKSSQTRVRMEQVAVI
jgi:hypothetical protein